MKQLNAISYLNGAKLSKLFVIPIKLLSNKSLMFEGAVKQLSAISSLNYAQLSKLTAIKPYSHEAANCCQMNRSNEASITWTNYKNVLQI